MRTAFVRALCDMAVNNANIWLLCGDLGYGVLDQFAKMFPERFVNVGVAEQNMIGVAAGLAMSGKKVYVYSIANFPIMRCLEQVRNDICYHALDVCIVAVGGGLVYGGHGYSHHGVEDLAVMRILPNMFVIAPGDPVETRILTHATLTRQGPSYLRLGRGGEPEVYRGEPRLEIGRASEFYSGRGITIISTGSILDMVVKAVDETAEKVAPPRVLSMHTLAPLDEIALRAAASDSAHFITVEEHGSGGLYSTVAEFLANCPGPRLHAMKLPREPVTVSGSQSYLREIQGLSQKKLAELILSLSNSPS